MRTGAYRRVVKAAQAAGASGRDILDRRRRTFYKDPKFLELLKVLAWSCPAAITVASGSSFTRKTDGISYGSQYNNAGMLLTVRGYWCSNKI
jgi:hypothetical protein